MKKNDIFTFTALNGVKVTGVVLSVLFVNHRSGHVYYSEYLCYTQNRLIVIHEDRQSVLTLKETIANYAILPEMDWMIAKSFGWDKTDSYEEAINIVIKQQRF